MKLAISNLASDDLNCIADTGVQFIECVFSKIGNITDLTHQQLLQWRQQLPAALVPYSVQSITYNCGLSNFAFDEQTCGIVDKIIALTKVIDLKRIVFGSPTLRSDAPDQEIFHYIDKHLKGTDILFCIEPNARCYGGKYFFDVEEICKFLDKHRYTNICTMVDTHNSWLESRDAALDVRDFKDFIRHVHASEAKLQGFTSTSKHQQVAAALADARYDGVVTFESLNMQGVKEFVDVYGI